MNASREPEGRWLTPLYAEMEPTEPLPFAMRIDDVVLDRILEEPD
jgi:hypothetical protein